MPRLREEGTVFDSLISLSLSLCEQTEEKRKIIMRGKASSFIPTRMYLGKESLFSRTLIQIVIWVFPSVLSLTIKSLSDRKMSESC